MVLTYAELEPGQCFTFRGYETVFRKVDETAYRSVKYPDVWVPVIDPSAEVVLS